MFVEYFEKGLSVIPIMKAGKAPIIPNWSRYCSELPLAQDVNKWDIEKNNIGIACGKASGIVVVDIDVNDKEILDICPPSPVVRVGAKGEARFFKYNPKIKSQSIPHILDILSGGRQVVVPPSIHPVTKKPYKWITQFTLENFDVEDLPELDLSFMDKIKRVHMATETCEGRNNKLVDIVTSMRSRGEAEIEIVNEVYNWDATFHSPPLFSDKEEGFKSKCESDTKMNAWRFVNSVTRTLINSGVASIGETGVIIAEDKVIAPLYKEKSFPRPTGLMGEVMELIEDMSERDMPNLALGGSIALMSILCANRFRFDDTWTNVYVLNLAPTGAGKSFPQRVIKKLIAEKIPTSLLGYGNYKSSSAISKNLVSRRERLDVIDEISGLFAHMKSGGIYQMEIVDELCKLWSDSNSKYMAGEYAGKENDSTCYNPCISILGSSTIAGIKKNMDELMVTKGLLPRFLIFSHDDYGKLKETEVSEEKIEKAVLKIQAILDIPKMESAVPVSPLEGPMYKPRNMTPKCPEAVAYFKEIKYRFNTEIERKDMSEALRSMLTRGKEQVMKLATMHAVSNGRAITVPDLKWAEKVFEVSLHNSKEFIEESSVSNEWEKDMVAVENVVRKKGFISKSVLMNTFRRIPRLKMNQVITQLVESEKITPATKIHSRNKTKTAGYKPV